MRRIFLLLAVLSCSACASTNEKPSQAKDCGCSPQRSGPLKINVSNSFIALAGPTKGDTSAAKKAGDFLVSSNGIKDAFENVTTDAVTIVRHKASGLICTSPQVVLTPKAHVTTFDPDMPAGCLKWESGVQNSLMVIPNSGAVSAGAALAALMSREQRLQPALTNKTEDGLGPKNQTSEWASGSLASVSGPAPRYVYFAVTTVQGWVVIDETSGSTQQADDCVHVAEAGLSKAIANIQKPGA